MTARNGGSVRVTDALFCRDPCSGAGAGLLRRPGRAAPAPKWVARPARRPAGWWSNGPLSPEPMIVVDRGCSGAQIHHDHGTAQASGHDSWSRRISHPGGLRPRSETAGPASPAPCQLIIEWITRLW